MSKRKKNSSNEKRSWLFCCRRSSGWSQTAAVVGKMGVAAMGGATAVGAAPVILAGTVLGIAAFGIKKRFLIRINNLSTLSNLTFIH